MERLTVKRPDGRWAIANNDGANPCEQMMKIPIAIDRLASYEDTGLEPEEIKELCTDEVAEVARTFRRMIQSGEIAHLQELLNAEQDGRLVVLPCKVGDTVYRLITPKDAPAVICEKPIRTVGEAANLVGWLGKKRPLISVFASREEAERALAGGADHA